MDDISSHYGNDNNQISAILPFFIIREKENETPIYIHRFIEHFPRTGTILGKSSCPRSILDFPSGSDSKASAYNAGDPCSIPGSGRSPGEGNGGTW